AAAFQAVERMVARHGPTLRWEDIAKGFELDGQHLHLASKAVGIFRPKEMVGAALSIRTSMPRSGRQARYQDEPLKDGAFAYKLQDNAADNHHNRLLRQAREMSAPLIYFFAVEPAVYQPIWPVFVRDIDSERMECTLSADDSVLAMQERGVPMVADAKAIEIRRQYVTTQAKRRLHQARFRLEVLRAYEEQCAVCLLPRSELLEAAHIIPDREESGEAVVPNGLSLCRLHHGVFDTDLMGIRPDGVIELSKELLRTQDGPTLEHAIKPFQGQHLHLPKRREDQPGRKFLEERYERFRKVG
ncbi:MAG TPA: HNH endonuclease, partial [Myxococcaceae bacterium]|nr:HNH endonuclease [Myxococcaceae bacterium]